MPRLLAEPSKVLAANHLGPCDQRAPCREIGQAIARLEPGDVVLVADGLYRRFTISAANGTERQPITVFATGSHAAIAGDASCAHQDLACCESILVNCWLDLTVSVSARGVAAKCECTMNRQLSRTSVHGVASGWPLARDVH